MTQRTWWTVRNLPNSAHEAWHNTQPTRIARLSALSFPKLRYSVESTSSMWLWTFFFCSFPSLSPLCHWGNAALLLFFSLAKLCEHCTLLHLEVACLWPETMFSITCSSGETATKSLGQNLAWGRWDKEARRTSPQFGPWGLQATSTVGVGHEKMICGNDKNKVLPQVTMWTFPLTHWG